MASEQHTGGFVFGEGLWPLGWGVGFIERPLAVVADAVDAWHALRLRKTSCPGDDLPRLLKRLPPLESPHGRSLLVGTEGDWTAYFDNALLGDPATWTMYLSKRLGCRGVIARHIPVGQYPFPATSFELLAPEGKPPLMYLRTVLAGIYDEGRWIFEADGEVQPFERPELYAARRIRDRLTRSVLLEYLGALGIDAARAGWYRGGVLYDDLTAYERRALTLEEARRQYAS